MTGYQLLAYDWASDSRTIYFTAAAGEQNRQQGLWSVDASSGDVSTIASTLPGNSGMAQSVRVVDPTGGPRNVFVALSQDTWCSPATIFRLSTSGGKTDTLATDVDFAMFAASPDGRQVAFTAVVFPTPPALCPPDLDSLVVMTTTSAPAYGRRAVERGLSWNQILPLSLSAAGSFTYARDVAGVGANYKVVLLVPAGGAPSRELIRFREFTADTIQALSPDVLWRNESPTLLLARLVQGRQGVDVYTVDGAAGTQTLQAVIPDATGPTSLSWSADGTSWAGWFVVKDLTPNEVERHNLRYRLYAKAPDQPDVRLLAEVEGFEGPWKLQVSPDGLLVAFLFARAFYVIPMR